MSSSPIPSTHLLSGLGLEGVRYGVYGNARLEKEIMKITLLDCECVNVKVMNVCVIH